MTNSNTAHAESCPRYKTFEANCEEAHTYPVFRVLEDEFVHQHDALPPDYEAAKERIDCEVQAILDAEIKAEIAEMIEREAAAEQMAAHRERTKEDNSADELRLRSVEDIEDIDARWAERYPRYMEMLDERFTAELFKHIHDLKEKRTALCFSGGGIRSASFGLGIVQGLARYGLLDKFDYLSTVSGGGYLGSWLSAWIHRVRLPAVITALKNEPEKLKLQPEPEPVRHLRSYSNYLNPKLGFLSADTWTLVAIIVRNMLLNWLLLIPIIMAGLILPRIVVAVVQMNARPGWLVAAAFWVGTISGLFAMTYMGVARPSANRPRKPNRGRLSQQTRFLFFCLLPMSLSAICLTSWWAWWRNAGGGLSDFAWWQFLLYGLALHLAAFVLHNIILLFKDAAFWRQRWQFHWKKLRWEPLAVILIGSFWGLVSWWATHKVFHTPFSPDPITIPETELYASFSAPMFMGLFLLALILFVGAASHVTDDDDREWWARFGAWLLIVALLWSVLSALVIFGPFGLMWLGTDSKLIKTILTALGGASGLLTIFGGMSAKTTSHQEKDGKSGGLLEYATKLAVPIFALTLLIVFALATSLLLRWLSQFTWLTSVDLRPIPRLPLDGSGMLNIIHHAPFWLLVLVMSVLFIISLITSAFVNINKFSLHSMYRNRLIRAYLGASRPQSERRPNSFTGFDLYDNIAMHELRHYEGKPTELKRKLLHVVNVCLNVTSGHNLAWQQRKAETFTVSPLHCGSFRLGYRKTEEYGGGNAPPGSGISLGTAVTISGAAASPNMGYHSSPALAFLMTIFNARLGWWLGNPGPAGNDRYGLHSYKRSGPRFALRPILTEALGHSDDNSPYVYLSDGGHFENLGLYEMVLRRAHLIVVADGSQDPQSRFEDLAGAVRKIRIDLGIPIDFIGGMPIYPKDDEEHRNQAKYFAVGLIRYSCADKDTQGENAKDGVIIYLKPAITGGEPIDILNYASTSPTFPHESTADQNYTEQQLESYRVLGSHVIQTICGPLAGDLPLMSDTAENFVKRVFDQTPRQMQPTELAGRFNIPKMFS